MANPKSNPKYRNKYHKEHGGICPFCGKKNINTLCSPYFPDESKSHYGIIHQDFECYDCGEQWTTIYRLVGVSS